MEIGQGVGIMYYSALVPCVMSALIGAHLASTFGVHAEKFTIVSIPSFSIDGAAKTVLLGNLMCRCQHTFMHYPS